MRKNHITGPEVIQFPPSLRDNTNLFYLDMKDNQLDDDVGAKLIELLDDNYFLEDLQIKGNLHISQSTKERLREECRKNLHIKEYVLPHLKSSDGDALNLIAQPSLAEAHYKNYNVEELALSDESFFRSDFIVKFIKMNRHDFHSLSLTRVHFDEHIKDLA